MQDHERLERSGYPIGLCGDKINFSSLILAVANTANAVVQLDYTVKHYGLEAIISIFHENDSVCYDADVISAFNNLIERKDKDFMESL